jgi:cytochrome bd-type quinol oxidase subunit 1
MTGPDNAAVVVAMALQTDLAHWIVSISLLLGIAAYILSRRGQSKHWKRAAACVLGGAMALGALQIVYSVLAV